MDFLPEIIRFESEKNFCTLNFAKVEDLSRHFFRSHTGRVCKWAKELAECRGLLDDAVQ